MPASLAFPTTPPFTSDLILFASKDAANSFFQAITVPDATVSDEGVIKKSQAANYSFTSLASSSYFTLQVLDEDLNPVNTELPSKNSFDELKSAFETLATAHDLLVTNLISAGILSAT